MRKRILPQGIKALFALPGALFLCAGGFAQTLTHGEPDSRLRARPAPAPEAQELAPRPVFKGEEPVTAHLASYYSADDAMTGWDVLTMDYASLLSSHQPILREIDLGARGRFVRLLAGPFEGQDDAVDLCRSLKARGTYCAVMDQAGEFVVSTEEWDG